jgi:hypothetical protein
MGFKEKRAVFVALLIFLTGSSEDGPVWDYEARTRSPSLEMANKDLLSLGCDLTLYSKE